MSIMPEYDLHDESHSEKVAGNISMLIGDKICSLPSLDLFLLYASAYLHDCGMAPAEFELKAMTIVHILRSDSMAEAIVWIRNNKNIIYGAEAWTCSYYLSR